MHYKTITSQSNPLVKELLTAEKKGFGTHFLVEGKHLVEMALTTDAAISKVFFTEKYRSGHRHLLDQLIRKGAEVFETTDRILSKLSDTETPQGIVAFVASKKYTLHGLILKKNPLLVIIDGIQDPGNLGTIIRTADAAGADAVIPLPGTCSVFIPKAVRATAGSIFAVQIIEADADDLLGWLRKLSIRLYVTDVRASKTLYQTDLSHSLAFAFGNEARGVSMKLKRASDEMIKVPIVGSAESLNVGISASVCLYEALRQRLTVI